MSRVSRGCGCMRADGDIVKLSGLCGCVHGASGRCYGVARFVRVRIV